MTPTRRDLRLVIECDSSPCGNDGVREAMEQQAIWFLREIKGCSDFWARTKVLELAKLKVLKL